MLPNVDYPTHLLIPADFLDGVPRDFLLHFIAAKSQAQIASSMKMGKTTVREYLQRAIKGAFANYQEVELLADEELASRLGVKKLETFCEVALRKPEYVLPSFMNTSGAGQKNCRL